VGILEGIVQNLPSAGGGNAGGTTMAAVVEQYNAQKHVLEQLQDKIRNLLRQAPQQNNSAVIKLQRDFQTIQSRATRSHETAARKLAAAAQQQKGSSSSSQTNYTEFTIATQSQSNSSTTTTNTSYQQQQQLQLMEDRLHEQIMREREEEIRTINQGMHTVNEIYKDLAHIVSTQQENIDQIEMQMDDSRANAENGLKQVELANEKFGTTQCCLM
jgi:t-SNARE complex subunit (syntaxin)